MNLYVGTSGGGVWIRPLSEMITSVELWSEPFPSEFQLKQNYPNPFNPVTKITYSIPIRAHVRISIFDAKGRFIQNLVNELKDAGDHLVYWDASAVGTGVYFYKIQTSEFTQVKKCMIIK